MKHKKGDVCTIDTYRVKQCENERVVSVVRVLKTPKKTDKTVLVHSQTLQADILVYKSDLRQSRWQNIYANCKI